MESRSASQAWPLPSSLCYVLLAGSVKALASASAGTLPPISLIKVRLMLPVQSQVGHAAPTWGQAHYSETSPVPLQCALEGLGIKR